MSRWPFRRVPPPRHGDASGDDLRDEMEHYLELRTEELMGQGMDPEAARREAERRFGDRDEIERRVRRATRPIQRRERGRMTMGQLAQDIRYTLRTFRRNPGFTLVAVLTLALALAGNTVIFSVLDAAVLRALPFPDHESLVFVNGYHDPDGNRAYRMASVPEFLDWRERSTRIDPMVAVFGGSATVGGEDGAERIQIEGVSSGYFEMLGATPVVGRTFTAPEADTPDGYPVAVLSEDLWERRFGADPGVAGTTVDLDGERLTVVGVLPRGFTPVNVETDLWVPLGSLGESTFQGRGSRFLPVAGRLVPGATQASAQAELDAIARELQAEHPDAHEDRWAEVVPFREGYLGTTGGLLWILFAAGVVLLAIAGANVANLLLVRAHGRQRELTVRRAVGAGGQRIVAQLLTESVVLSAAGALVGLVLAAWGLDLLTTSLPDDVLPSFVDPGLSLRVFAFTLAGLVAVGLGAGLLPALGSARGDLADRLRSGGRGLAGGRGRLAQKAFVVTQVGLAILLLVGAGLLTRSVRSQLAVDPGMEMDGIHVFRVQPAQERYPDPASLELYARDLLREVGSVPGVSRVAVASDFPFRGRTSGSYIVRPDDVENLIRYHRHSVSPGYFELLGVELLAGRTFQDSDDADAPGVAVVTRAMVDRVFPELPDVTAAVGQSVFIGPPSDPENRAEIVGVVEDVRYRDLTQDMMAGPNSPDVFFAVAQVPTRTHEVAFQADLPLEELLPAVRQAVARVDAGTPLFLPQSLRDAWRRETSTSRFAAFLMGLFSLVALALACVGIYGVLAFAVNERAREIAVKRALGAPAAQVARAVIWDGVRLALMGLALGLVVALATSGLLERFLFDVGTLDPATYLGVGAVMFVTVVSAAALPAWRATRNDPVEALTGD